MGVRRKILTWAVLGFRGKPLLRGMFPQFWWCSNNSSSPTWKGGHTRSQVPTNLGRHHSPLPYVLLSPSQTSACQHTLQGQPRLSHLFLGGLGGSQRGERHHVRELESMTEELAHRTGGTEQRAEPAAGKEGTGGGVTISSNKPLGLSAVLSVISLLLTLL